MGFIKLDRRSYCLWRCSLVSIVVEKGSASGFEHSMLEVRRFIVMVIRVLVVNNGG